MSKHQPSSIPSVKKFYESYKNKNQSGSNFSDINCYYFNNMIFASLDDALRAYENNLNAEESLALMYAREGIRKLNNRYKKSNDDNKIKKLIEKKKLPKGIKIDNRQAKISDLMYERTKDMMYIIRVLERRIKELGCINANYYTM